MAKPTPQTTDLHFLHSFWFNHDCMQLLDLLLSTTIFVADGAPSSLHVVFVTNGASSPLHVMCTTKVN